MPIDVKGAAWQYGGCGGKPYDVANGKAVYKPHTEISKLAMAKVPKFGTSGEDIVAYSLGTRRMFLLIGAVRARSAIAGCASALTQQSAQTIGAQRSYSFRFPSPAAFRVDEARRDTL